jgi:hypothetical protein
MAQHVTTVPLTLLTLAAWLAALKALSSPPL